MKTEEIKYLHHWSDTDMNSTLPISKTPALSELVRSTGTRAHSHGSSSLAPIIHGQYWVGPCTTSVPCSWAEQSNQWHGGHGSLHSLRGGRICLKGDKVCWKSNFYSFMCSSVKGDNLLNCSIHDPFKSRGRNLRRKPDISLISSITLKIKYFKVFLEHQNFLCVKMLVTIQTILI